MRFRGKTFNVGFDIGPLTRWGSLIGGGALLLLGVNRGRPRRTSRFEKKRTWLPGWLMALAGGDMLYYGIRGEGHLCNLLGIGHTKAGGGAHTSVAYRSSIRVDEAVTINKPAAELYRFWHNFENLPKIMRHVKSVRVIGKTKSRWVAKAPAGLKAEWDAEIINDIPNKLIGWRSLGHPGVDNAGSVHFKPLPGNRGTNVRVVLRYDAPGDKLGTAFARLFGEDPQRQVREDLRRLKAAIETGRVRLISGRPPAKRPRRNRKVA